MSKFKKFCFMMSCDDPELEKKLNIEGRKKKRIKEYQAWCQKHRDARMLKANVSDMKLGGIWSRIITIEYTEDKKNE